jgi:hypothetical protein
LAYHYGRKPFEPSFQQSLALVHSNFEKVGLNLQLASVLPRNTVLLDLNIYEQIQDAYK